MNKSDLIDAYIQNKASAAELDQIHRLMEEDSDFKAELTFQLELRQAVVKSERHQLKQRLQHIEQQSATNKRTRIVSWAWRVAALLIVGLAVSWFFNRPTDLEQLYAQHFEPYPNIVAPTVRDVNPNTGDIEKAFQLYDNSQYGAAAEAFKMLHNNDETGYANFYYALSLLADQQVHGAVEALEDPSWQVPDRLVQQTNWYLALGYLKLQNQDKAKQFLEKTLESGGTRAVSAQNILSKIK